MKCRTQLIVALDVESLPKAKRLVDLLYPEVKIFKVGWQLFIAAGKDIIRYIKSKGGQVFLDLKFYDIPNTVAQASKEMVRLGVFMFNLHAQGGGEMMQQAQKAARLEAKRLERKRPFILAVTVLTSQQDKDTLIKVLELTRDAKESGLDGVVCAVSEAGAIRQGFGKRFLIVTPGIRLQGAALDDQKRTALPKQAKEAGVDYIVVGRPIIQAKNPLEVAREILEQIK